MEFFLRKPYNINLTLPCADNYSLDYNFVHGCKTGCKQVVSAFLTAVSGLFAPRGMFPTYFNSSQINTSKLDCSG